MNSTQRILALASILFGCFVIPLAGQILIVSPQPVAAGQDINAILINNTAADIHIGRLAEPTRARLYNARGEILAAHRNSTSFSLIAPGGTGNVLFASTTLPFGPLATGHYVIEVSVGGSASPTSTVAASFTVGPILSFAPAFMATYQSGLTPYTDTSEPSSLRIVNTSTAALTFPGASWLLETHGTSGTANTAGVIPPAVIAAGDSLSLPWPGNPQDQETEELTLSWNDPIAGTQVDTVIASGPMNFYPPPAPTFAQAATFAILHRPQGDIIPLGGTLDVWVQTTGARPCIGSCPPSLVQIPPFMALAAALSPGVISLRPGLALPLAVDSLLVASFSGGLAGVILNSPGSTQYENLLPWPGHSAKVSIVHPGPALSGLAIYVSALGFDPAQGITQTSLAHRLVIG